MQLLSSDYCEFFKNTYLKEHVLDEQLLLYVLFY